MGEQHLILLIGDSILIDGIAISLAERNGVLIRRISRHQEDLAGCVAAMEPCLIVTAWDAEWVPVLFRLSHDRPGLRFAAVDAESERFILVQGQQHSALSMEELIETLLPSAAPEAIAVPA